MKENIIRHLKHVTSAKVLAAIFLLFSVYTGIAALPLFLTNTGTALEEDCSLSEYIKRIDEQYHGMLSTVMDQNTLHNKSTYINFNGLMANALGQIEMNERIKLKNGHLAQFGHVLPEDRLDEVFQNLKALSDKHTGNGRQFLFVLAPSQTYQQEELFPAGYEDQANIGADYLVRLLEENGIPHLDLRKSMAEAGMTNADAFFVTDHHWTPQTGFWAYGKIIEELYRNGAIGQISQYHIDPQNYNFQIYENVFLGSSGKRTGQYFAGLDDFCVISPKYDTSISVKIENTNFDSTGNFLEVAYNQGALARMENQNFFNENPYGIYGWGDRSLVWWRNESAPEDQKIMLIGDSYGNVPFSLMSMYFSSCDELDMRHFKGDFQSYYEENTPDTIVLLVNLNSLFTANTTYEFFPETAS